MVAIVISFLGGLAVGAVVLWLVASAFVRERCRLTDALVALRIYATMSGSEMMARKVGELIDAFEPKWKR